MIKSITIKSVIFLCLFILIAGCISITWADEKENVAISYNIKRSTSSELQLNPEVLQKQILVQEIEEKINSGLQTVSPPQLDRELIDGMTCDNPISITVIPFADAGQTTCGMGNDYDNTCLGYYDGGKDIIYELELIYPGFYIFELETYNTSYSGMMISANCPDTGNCIAFTTSSSSGYQYLQCVFLESGTYYVMIDTWPSPDCIPEFDFNLSEMFCDDFSNNNCLFAEEITESGENLAFTTNYASFDGYGECMTSPNIWFTHEAITDDMVIVTLCGSSYDTKLAVYEGDDCSDLNLLGCNDDFCGLQSELQVQMESGKTYYIEVGGYSNNAGDGFISIYYPLHENVECGPESTPEGEVCGEEINNGCNADPPVFGIITCGEDICGELWADDNSRDTDWYEFTLDDWTICSFEAISDLPFIMGIVETGSMGSGDCNDATGYLEPYITGDVFVNEQLTTTLPPGTYWVFVAPSVYDGYPCFEDGWQYQLNLNCELSIPEGCDAGGGCDEYIQEVHLGEFNNYTGCSGYYYHDPPIIEMYKGVGYPITIVSGNGYSGDDCAIWIDWNHNYFYFSPDDRIEMEVETGNGPFTAIITPPLDAEIGLTPMRIRLSYLGEPDDMSPCGITTYGEVEDYNIVVLEYGGPTYLQAPDPFMIIDRFALDPISGHLYISNFVVPGEVISGWENCILAIDGCEIPIYETEIIADGWGELQGNILRIAFYLNDYFYCQEIYQGDLLYDEIISPYTLSYDYEGTPSQWSGDAVILGHRSGDLDLDGEVNVADITCFVNYLFKGGDLPRVMDLANVDGTPGIDVGDITYLVAFLFRGGERPQTP